jgi:hypothetical protein
MPLRLPCKPIPQSPGTLLYSYWGALGYYRPIFDVFLIGPGNQIVRVPAQVDSASDWVVFEAGVAATLGLGFPMPRQTTLSGAAGTQSLTLSFPDDGVVSLFVTDYREYAYLPAPVIGFHQPGPAASQQRSVLGQTGFLQFFRHLHDPVPRPPIVELDPIAGFPGQNGVLPKGGGLYDFIHRLRSGP